MSIDSFSGIEPEMFKQAMIEVLWYFRAPRLAIVIYNHGTGKDKNA